MSWCGADRIERWVDAGAAALFAATVGFALARIASSVIVVAGAMAAGFATYRSLRAIEPESPRFVLPDFTPVGAESVELGELILTDADRLRATGEAAGTDRELVLDDVLAQMGEDSRVVRLFDPAAIPTPGQLKARIDRHLHETPPKTTPPDASQTLYEALAELRRSLR